MPPVVRKPAVAVSLVAVPEVSGAVLYGLQEVFAAVGVVWESITGLPSHTRMMAPRIVAETTRRLDTLLGVPIAPDAEFATVTSSDIVIVPDLTLDDDMDARTQWPMASEWVRQQYDAGATICSVCTGSLMLAAAGVLSKLEATTHWSAHPIFQSCFPDVDLRPERVLTPAGPEHRIVTCGGSASWTDLALYLIARFSSEGEARRIAKIFLFGDRSQGQMPFAAMARPRQHEDLVIANSQVWAASHYSVSSPVEAMIRESGLSRRTFSRRFKKATGYSPKDYMQTLRVEEAKQMLEASSQAVECVAAAVGYEDSSSFRRVFKRLTGISPRDHRRRFRKLV